MKIVVQFADGTSEEHVLKNGEVFADTFVRADVPLSTDAGDFTRRGQLRYFALNLGKKAALSKIVLESFDNDIVPATVAITAGDEPVAAKPLSTPESRTASRDPSTSSGSSRATSRGESPAGASQAQSASATEGPKEGGRGDAPPVAGGRAPDRPTGKP